MCASCFLCRYLSAQNGIRWNLNGRRNGKTHHCMWSGINFLSFLIANPIRTKSDHITRGGQRFQRVAQIPFPALCAKSRSIFPVIYHGYYFPITNIPAGLHILYGVFLSKIEARGISPMRNLCQFFQHFFRTYKLLRTSQISIQGLSVSCCGTGYIIERLRPSFDFQAVNPRLKSNPKTAPYINHLHLKCNCPLPFPQWGNGDPVGVLPRDSTPNGKAVYTLPGWHLCP